jgi:hypothetical protein
MTIGGARGIGQQDERPALNSLIAGEPLRRRERNDRDRDAASIEALLRLLHLPEVLLAGESGEMAQEDDEQETARVLAQGGLSAV